MSKAFRQSNGAVEIDLAQASLLDRLPFPYQSLDSDARIREVNKSWLRTLGYTREEVIGEKLTSFLSEDSIDEFNEKFKYFTSISGSFSGELELFAKSGKPLQFIVDGILEKADDGALIRTYCFFRDITTTYSAESELQRLSARTSAILGAIPEILMEVDNSNVYTWANQAGFEFFGPNALGKNADEFFVKPLNPDLIELFEPKLKNNKDSVNVLSWQRRVDGEQRLLSWCRTPLLGEEGTPVGALSSARDITDAYMQNERVKRLNSILKGIRDINQLINQEKDVNRLLDGACENLVGPFGFVTAWAVLFKKGTRTVESASLAGLGSAKLEEFKKRMCSGVLTDCGKMCVESEDFVVVQEREQCSNCVLREFHWKDDRLENGTLVLPLTIRNGLIGIFAASIQLHDVRDPEVAALFKEVVRDISQAIEKIQNARELEQYRLERIKSGKLESLGVMAGGIAHDFNNVLVGILGNISLAKLDIDSDTHLKPYLDSAEAAVKRARELTHRLLTFAKGGTPIKAPLSIKDILQESVKFLFPDSSVRVVTEIPNDLELALGERSQIQQAINNLLLNAKEALSDCEKPEITICCENLVLKKEEGNSLSDGNYVKIRISDNGPGIPGREISEKVFDPYFTTKTGGNGLGLSSVFSIMKAHDGTALLDSTSEHGSTFSIVIPAAVGEDAQAKKTATLSAADETNAPTDARILVMDDEPSVCGVLAKYIENFGWESDFSEDGKSALEKYKEAIEAGHPYDMVILDLMVPKGMGGVETAKEILKINPAARLIASSGYSDDDAIAKFADYGFAAALRKPYAMEELRSTLIKTIQ